ncbi:MAG: DeoR/GlpR transcriptional regulator [Lentisphaerae bacterium]|nr:DeoR/GlpR transcriptional regulator [Lentisphaerota bacterium]MCP4099961.1 DeoR/GlpR transcriptional regulator [Lentisphaerota bacterium]
MSNCKRKLLSTERESLILKALGEGVSTITELSAQLNVSEATVRRDLHSLEEQGKAKRIHGGAVRVKFPQTEPIFTEKAGFHAQEKKSIAEKALEYIEDNDSIYLDGGSTILPLARMLDSRKNLTIVTNSMMAAAELMESQHRLILLGGEFRALSRTLVGPLTQQIVNTLHINKAFMGTIGFTVDEGISTTDPGEAFTKEIVMRRAGKVYVLVDSSKIGVPSFAVSGSINDIDTVITDENISPKLVKELEDSEVKIVF